VKVIKAGRRLVLISATGNEGQILKIRSPLVFSSKDAKLFLATLDEVLTALCGRHLQACQCKRAGGGILIEPTRSVSAVRCIVDHPFRRKHCTWPVAKKF
jgi:hypothetical protein